MNDVKYIVFTVPGLEGERVIIFNGMLVHKIVGESIEKQKGTIVSAGFCKFNTDDDGLEVQCYGKSESLKVESRGFLDSLVVLNTLNGNCGYM